MGDLLAPMPPQHFDEIEPGTRGRQLPQPQTVRCAPHDGVNLGVGRRGRVSPRARDGLGGVVLQERWQPRRARPTPCRPLAQDHHLTCMGMDGAKAIPLRGVARRRAHALLPLGTPPGAEGRQPRASQRIGLGTARPALEALAGRCHRLCLPGMRLFVGDAHGRGFAPPARVLRWLVGAPHLRIRRRTQALCGGQEPHGGACAAVPPLGGPIQRMELRALRWSQGSKWYGLLPSHLLPIGYNPHYLSVCT